MHLEPQAGVSAADMQHVQQQATKAIEQQFNGRFVLSDEQGQRRPLRVQVDFVPAGQEHARVRLQAGQGKPDAGNWYVENDPIFYAHEIGHALGLPDEYQDAKVDRRATHDGPGRHHDHSLMDANHSAFTRLHLRHGLTLMNSVAQATGRSWQVEVVPRPYAWLLEPWASNLKSQPSRSGRTGEKAVHPVRGIAQRLR